MTGLVAHLFTTPVAVPISFTEEAQRGICISLQRKAAMASGIEALARRAIDSGDSDSLDQIEALAQLLAEELQHLAAMAGQMKTAKPIA
ncbi:TPA: hypothetical protein ACPWIL_006128 [Pseudomonas aeruginosa]|uniref:hypothetical protein n=1 Tax=Pseudomonas aeruginosa TaxID=287 RepID=UPI000F88D3D4|nr:hypothetical protein [Pseudomonas aeruginosa]MDI3585876.1 hypothetical protein [Pseudomonas aeruginosa]MDI3811487.1 hypothetical protein [Pseudomonas aeruginosa]RUI11498.1 hypothetical protein IPC447_29905 [Pseudomonas aeruginosa]